MLFTVIGLDTLLTTGYKLTDELYIHYQTSGFLSTADGSITRSQAVARIDDRTASQ